MPHPSGDIAVQLQKTGVNGLAGSVTLPAGVAGTLRWKGKTLPLKPGKQTVNVPEK